MNRSNDVEVRRKSAHPWWAAVAAAAVGGFCFPCHTAQPDRSVSDNTVVSRRDPAVQIKLPSSACYVGADRFLLSDRELGDFDDCELHVFVNADDARNVRKLYWVQFEAYLPSQPSLTRAEGSSR